MNAEINIIHPLLRSLPNAIVDLKATTDHKKRLLQKKTKKENKEAYLSLDTILSNTPAVIYSYKIVDGKKVFTYIHNNIVNVLGFEPQEFIDKPELWTSRIHPEDINLIKTVPGRLEKEQSICIEYRFYHKKGFYRWLQEKQNIITNDKEEDEIAAISWDITERKQGERLIQARVNLLSFSHNHTVEEILQKTLDEICELVDSPIGFCHLVDKDENMLTLKAWSTATLNHFCKIKDIKNIQYNVDEAGVWADCLHERRPVIHNNYASLPHRKGVPEAHPALTRELVVPILRQGRVVAILGVGNKPQDYTEQDLQLVSYFADMSWTLTKYKRSEEKVRYFSFHDTLTGLYNRAYLEIELQRLDMERQLPIGIVMADLNGLKLINDTYGYNKGDKILQTIAKILKGSCRKEDIIARWGGDEFVILLPQTTRKEGEKLCKRIKSKCNATYLGDIPVSLALGVAAKEDISSNLFGTLKEAEDFMCKQKLAEDKSIRSAVLNALLKTLGARSYETEEHTCRMQILALKFGEKLGLSDPELARLSLLITLHDIGKINVPEEILTKKEPLTAKEWKIIKKHPETGSRIARSTGEFAHVAEDILAHHEHWDGSGYPQGLKGEQIPLLARITSIVDAYEVITNGRPYKEQKTPLEALEEIKRCSGTQFDAELVKFFSKYFLEYC
jgi:diguanylate cyclase (GGDEF)-like protein/PAS domain S-box-containing protein/putative nucleotidyltransferase with HDIG domain